MGLRATTIIGNVLDAEGFKMFLLKGCRSGRALLDGMSGSSVLLHPLHPAARTLSLRDGGLSGGVLQPPMRRPLEA
jgi:hypothetical protein